MKQFELLKKRRLETVVYDRINPLALFSILLAGILLGVIVHEAAHLLLISQPVTVSLHFGDPEVFLSTCCLKPGENDFEGLAQFLQFFTMLAWVFLNKEIWLHEVKREII